MDFEKICLRSMPRKLSFIKTCVNGVCSSAHILESKKKNTISLPEVKFFMEIIPTLVSLDNLISVNSYMDCLIFVTQGEREETCS